MDGFRFDLASALCRDPLGAPIPAPPLIRQIAKDPVLSKARRALPASAVHKWLGPLPEQAGCLPFKTGSDV